MIKSRHIILLLVLLGIILLTGYVIFNVFGDDENDSQNIEQFSRGGSNGNSEDSKDNEGGEKEGEVKEEWTNYVQAPFDFVKTGSVPINFYIKPAYRKPYGYPFKFRSSYPYDHYRYGPNN